MYLDIFLIFVEVKLFFEVSKDVFKSSKYFYLHLSYRKLSLDFFSEILNVYRYFPWFKNLIK
jgi:hypothetical protein